MSLRETLRNMPALFGGLAVVVILVAGYVSYQSVKGPSIPAARTNAFYTTDDGKTWFADSLTNLPPYKTADGKEAVAAVVVSCDGGKDPFVTYLWRYTPEGKRVAQSGMGDEQLEFMKEMKKPGAAEWIKTADQTRVSSIQTIECPQGDANFVEMHP